MTTTTASSTVSPRAEAAPRLSIVTLGMSLGCTLVLLACPPIIGWGLFNVPRRRPRAPRYP